MSALTTRGGKPLGAWEQVSADDYENALEIVPPAAQGRGWFLMGEPYSALADYSATVWCCYAERGGRHWHALVTRRDLREYLADLADLARQEAPPCS